MFHYNKRKQEDDRYRDKKKKKGKYKKNGSERNTPEGGRRKEENHHVQGGETGEVLSFKNFSIQFPPLPSPKKNLFFSFLVPVSFLV
jgi:hypothetical protein